MNIRINNLNKAFGEKTAVDIPQLTINNGEIVGIVGNNGAGKTTLFRLMLDLIKADEGDISIQDDSKKGASVEINPAKSEDWKVFTGAYIDEGFLIDFLTPEEFFTFIGKVNGLIEHETYERTDMFKQFMNGEILGQEKLIRSFSAGNKQKIGIISAFINRPKVAILDEPFNFLDPSSQNSLKHIIKNYHAQNDATILISSHNLYHIIDVSSRIILLENGRIIKDMPNTGDDTKRELEDYFNIAQ